MDRCDCITRLKLFHSDKQGVKPFRTVIYTVLVLHMMALFAFFCISGARAFLNRQPGRNWRNMDRPRQIQVR